jgi:crotonobetainyl-CoA:carnitine CoA-transferase CaiB-like acyl-CoA transferase
MSDELPLSGIKVFDATQGVAGPHATMLLAQHGADVTKIEPLEGDWGRTLGKMYGDLCAHAITFNRGKKSLALDLKNEEGKAIAQKLAREADVVVESFRPGVMARFGLSYEEIRKHNPKVVYLSLTGFGQTGPNSKLPTTDSVIQAFSGWMTLHRDAEGTPMRSGMIAVDVMTGLYAFQALSAAILRQVRFGKGAYIDCSLMQAAAAFQSAKVTEYFLENGEPQVLYVPVGTMKTKDGYLNVTAMREHHYVSLCKVLGRNDLAADPRYNTREKRIEREKELMPIVRAEFLKRTTDEWAKELTEAGVMNAKVNTYQDFMDDAHVKAVNGLVWIDHQGLGKMPMANIPGLPPIAEGTPMAECPHTGQHTVEVLKRNGFSEAEINRLLAAKAIGVEHPMNAAAAE